MDARRAWLRFGLTMAGCAVGGFTLAVLALAVISKHVWERAA